MDCPTSPVQYVRAQAMAWCEENGGDHFFGLAGNRALHALAYEVADGLKVRRTQAAPSGGSDSAAAIHRAPFVSEFDGTLVGLRAAVRKEDSIEASGRRQR